MATNYKPGTFARFFRAVKGRLVTRFGTARYGTSRHPMYREGLVFGGHRPPMKASDQRHAKVAPLSARPCNPIEIDETIVTPITKHEAMQYRREYNNVVRQGDLIEASEGDYTLHLEADAQRAAEATAREEKLVSDREDAANRDAEAKARTLAAAKKKAAKAAKGQR